jgi:hypothetical protein
MSNLQHFLDVESHVRDGVGEIRDHLDRGFTAPAFARQIAGTGFVVLRQHRLVDGFDVAAGGDVEQAVPGRDHGAGLVLGEAGHGSFLNADTPSGGGFIRI